MSNKDLQVDKTLESNEIEKPEFKKPCLIGKVGRLPRKLIKQPEEKEATQEETVVQTQPTQLTLSEKDIPAHTQKPQPDSQTQIGTVVLFPYKEPAWSALPKNSTTDYSFDVLKNGSIIESINLMNKPFWIFGRLEGNDICMQHPTVSRYHAVLQYRGQATDNHERGFYIYDLDSTHGTFLNKNRLKPKVYARVQVGHMLKFGGSSRTFILNGPEDDAEEESELTVTELKKQRAEELLRREEAALKAQQEKEERRRKEEEKGVDWGMGDDADEETDLAENPFAQTNNEELYLDDPKKALRGFFEREGLDLEYDCSEQGMGQFLCKVMLPLDDDRGRPIYAEVLHKGKKKEAVVQCALEACRILDRYGVLRQATHESRKRKAKNWEENDYYDSDEDTFLDRTGTIEKKRENRMKSKKPPQAETYQNLLEKEKSISESIQKIEKQLEESNKKQQTQSSSNTDEDSLDSYMNELKTPKLDKQTISRLKSELLKLKQDHVNVIKLINIAKPADLPPLVSQYPSDVGTGAVNKNKLLPVFGKRKKIKVQLPAKPTQEIQNTATAATVEDEEVEEEEQEAKQNRVAENEQEMPNNKPTRTETKADGNGTDDSSDSDDKNSTNPEQRRILTVQRFEKALNQMHGSPLIKDQDKVSMILSKLKKIASNGHRIQIDWNILKAKRRKVNKLISDLKNDEHNEKLEHRASMELNRILIELSAMLDNMKTVTKIAGEIKSIITDKMAKEEEEAGTSGLTEEETEEEIEKKKRKNQRRIQQRQVRAESEKQKGYQEDAVREDYNMWVPPDDQSGDGRTSLNEKFGY